MCAYSDGGRIGATGQLICASVCQVAQATLEFESQGFDLETGSVLSLDVPPPAASDFSFADNSARPNPIVLFQNQATGTQIAFLDGTPFDSVGCSVGTPTFTIDLIDSPFDFDDTIIIRTADGNVFKVGKATNNGNNTVTFSYARLL